MAGIDGASPSSPFSRSVTKATARVDRRAAAVRWETTARRRAARCRRRGRTEPRAFDAAPSAPARCSAAESRNSSSMRDARGLRARGFSAISTSSGTITVRDQYDILSRWNGNHCGSSMISTGITGTARHGTCRTAPAGTRVNTLVRSAPPARGSPRARGACAARRVVADHLQREIRLDAGAHVEGAVVEQRPAAMLALDAAQIDADLRFQRGVDRSPR